MKQSNYDLKIILDIPHWEQIQDRIAKLTGTAVITIDFKGVPVTDRQEFLLYLQSVFYNLKIRLYEHHLIWRS